MKVTCKSSSVEWFKTSEFYNITNSKLTDCYGTIWHCIESQLTPGVFTVYGLLGRSIATMIKVH